MLSVCRDLFEENKGSKKADKSLSRKEGGRGFDRQVTIDKLLSAATAPKTAEHTNLSIVTCPPWRRLGEAGSFHLPLVTGLRHYLLLGRNPLAGENVSLPFGDSLKVPKPVIWSFGSVRALL